MNRIYSDLIITQTTRLLSFLDRNDYSPTYGCSDRNYWHYKITDFPSARFQEICLTLTLLYIRKYPGNPYYQKEKIKKWAEASIKYWSKIQAKDGSFNEWYPNEKSFVATAFTLYTVTESYLLLKLNDSDITTSIVKAADWLINNKGKHPSNQQAGAIIALHNTYLITNSKKYLDASEEKLTLLLRTQTSEGWFPEYGGFDVGYSSVLIDYLAKYYTKSNKVEILPHLEKLMNFLQYFIHPNSTYGGEYGSRNTEYLLPNGFELLSRIVPLSQIFSTSIHTNLQNNNLNLDDRYLCYNGYTYLQAYDNSSKLVYNNNNVSEPFTKSFPLSGIYLQSTPIYYLIVNFKKGGSLKIYSKHPSKLVYESSGIIGNLADGTIFSSQQLDSDYKISLEYNKLVVEGFFHKANFIYSSPLLIIISRIFLTLFTVNLGFISNFLKESLRKRLITVSKQLPLKFKRVILLKAKTVIIENYIITDKPNEIKNISTTLKFSTAYIPSSKYFNDQELSVTEPKTFKQEINKEGVVLKTVVDI